MDEKDIRSIALFFFFADLDEARASEDATLAVASAREWKKRHPQDDPGQIVVQATHEIWRRRRGAPGQLPETSGREWILPAGLSPRSWNEFVKAASPEEVSTVIWSAILGYSDECIAAGLGLSPGTIRYRWSRGLEKLGRLVGPRVAAVPR